MLLTNEEFRLFRTLIYEESGIWLKDSRRDFLEKNLMKRMTDIDISSPYWYYKILIEKNEELSSLLDLLTINETSFFRNRPQLNLFRDRILPGIIHSKGNDPGPRLKIWSAGCSTGEEPFSIAMIISELIPYYRQKDVTIYASDISLTALETADKGEYDVDKVQATVDDHYITRYFKKNGGYYRVNDEIRKTIIFDYHNLKNDNGLTDFDVIFCRNVMIYFDEEEQRRLIEKFYRNLKPYGYLLLGHTESLYGWNTEFKFIHDNKGTAYRKPCGDENAYLDCRGR
jgi:chemotaxis protein methyltransferase CheR